MVSRYKTAVDGTDLGELKHRLQRRAHGGQPAARDLNIIRQGRVAQMIESGAHLEVLLSDEQNDTRIGVVVTICYCPDGNFELGIGWRHFVRLKADGVRQGRLLARRLPTAVLAELR